MPLGRSRVGVVTIVVLGWLATWSVTAEPLDLTDATPRWIEVRFEVSPADQPGSLDREWSVARPARLESHFPDGLLRIRIPAPEVEAHLRSTGTDAIAGSFSEFVWTLDPKTGHVVDAELTGRVRESIRLGPFRATAQVEIQVDMDTRSAAGYEPDHGIFGVSTNRFCTPDSVGRKCVAVTPVRFDPSRGYVNAVGMLRAASAVAEIRAFSPLGEVEFRENSPRGTETVVSGPKRTDAL